MHLMAIKKVDVSIAEQILAWTHQNMLMLTTSSHTSSSKLDYFKLMEFGIWFWRVRHVIEAIKVSLISCPRLGI